MILTVFAEFERDVIRERILASHSRGRAEGKTIGRPSMLNDGLISSVYFCSAQRSLDPIMTLKQRY
jgi:DNA invertase Pin-like site-specific DNA recombinase